MFSLTSSKRMVSNLKLSNKLNIVIILVYNLFNNSQTVTWKFVQH